MRMAREGGMEDEKRKRLKRKEGREKEEKIRR